MVPIHLAYLYVKKTFTNFLGTSLIALTGLLIVPLFASAQQSTRMTAMPSMSDNHVVFVYDNDLWVVGRNGGTARRLTSADGREENPVFSPDGSMIAFNAPYDGNMDVYVMPAQGGPAKRLTWHPGSDVVHGFTPDGNSVLFESPRSVHTTRFKHLYTVDVEGGVPERVPVPTGYKSAISPDGNYLAYTPLSEAFHQWKNYRGGRTSRIWIMDLDDLSVTEIPKPEGGSNDTDPMWTLNSESLYFNSDRNGEFNIYRYDRDSGEVEQITDLGDFPVLEPSAASDGTIVFEHAGFLHRLNSSTGEVSQLPVRVYSDLKETTPRFISGSEWVRNAAPSPDIARVAFEYRGEIVTVPAEKGDPRNITSGSGVHNRSPVWSPDGSKIAWFSDKNGEYALWTGNQDGSGEPQRIELDGAGFYDQPEWSPDGNYIAYRDNSQSHWVVELETGEQTKIAQEPVYSPLNLMSSSWSPDSKWLAYTIQDHGLIRTVYAWSTETKESIRITDGMSEASSPVFDPNGEFLYVLASTDAGPLKDWFSQASIDMQMDYGIYAITLRQDGPDPLPPQSDEVTSDEESEEETGEEEISVRIDPEGIEDRIVSLPLQTENRRNLRVGSSGELYWIEAGSGASISSFGTPGDLKKITLKERTPKTLASGVNAFELDKPGKKILYNQGGNWFVTAIADQLPSGKGKLDLDAIQVKLNPAEEWEQIFHEAWRINRDYFYDPNFHGADWEAMREKYAEFLPDLATRHDLFRVIRWMLSELAVGHSYQSQGDLPFRAEGNPPGLLGADYEVANGRYRFETIYGGLNWNPNLRSPLRTPGVDVKEGEYLISVNDEDLRPPQSVYEPFAGLAGKQVKITVADNQDGNNARNVTVVPVSNESNMRYLNWVEANQEYVDEKTDGKVAYVHVPNTADAGHEMFKRYFYPQSHKDALILDERYNGGGLIADYYIEFLRREYISHWNFRYGKDLISPRGAILGPKVMLADETAGSGGDLLPWMFKKFEIGPVIGKRTWGGLVGILGFPVLRDGGTITAPNLAFWTEEDGFAVENEGVTPDIEVEQLPAEVNRGIDPQLERAIEEILQMLEENPPKEYERPEYPVRTKN